MILPLIEPTADSSHSSDADLSITVVNAVKAAAEQLRASYDPSRRPADVDMMLAALEANDAGSLAILRPALHRARACPIWSEDTDDETALSSGEWWVTDAAEGNINHVHGLPDWGVSATLVRDGAAVLTAMTLPITGNTYRAVRGGGAFVDGTPLRTSTKTDLGVALVGTGQASHDDGPELHRRLSQSASAMLDRALLLRVSVPATLQMLDVAAGRADVFWQFTPSRAALLCGALLVTEAGGTVTDAAGGAWTSASSSFLAAAPGVHGAAVAVLAASIKNRKAA